jgi:hypothetical protein
MCLHDAVDDKCANGYFHADVNEEYEKAFRDMKSDGQNSNMSYRLSHPCAPLGLNETVHLQTETNTHLFLYIVGLDSTQSQIR